MANTVLEQLSELEQAFIERCAIADAAIDLVKAANTIVFNEDAEPAQYRLISESDYQQLKQLIPAELLNA